MNNTTFARPGKGNRLTVKLFFPATPSPLKENVQAAEKFPSGSATMGRESQGQTGNTGYWLTDIQFSSGSFLEA
jgi:hypothetical protein